MAGAEPVALPRGISRSPVAILCHVPHPCSRTLSVDASFPKGRVRQAYEPNLVSQQIRTLFNSRSAIVRQ